MNQALRKDAQQILASSLQAVLPDEAVPCGTLNPTEVVFCWWLPVRQRGRWRRLRCGRWAGWTAAWW